MPCASCAERRRILAEAARQAGLIGMAKALPSVAKTFLEPRRRPEKPSSQMPAGPGFPRSRGAPKPR